MEPLRSSSRLSIRRFISSLPTGVWVSWRYVQPSSRPSHSTSITRGHHSGWRSMSAIRSQTISGGASTKPCGGRGTPADSRTGAGPSQTYNPRLARKGNRGRAKHLMQQMQIYGVSFDMVGKQPIVLLKTVDGNRFLPIWIGHPEAAAILMKLQGAQTPRPMTHDLLNDLLETARGEVRARLGHRAARQHLLRLDHDLGQRLGDRDRLAPLGRDRARGPLPGADLRRRGRDRGVLDRVRARGRGPGGGRRALQGLPRRGLPRGFRRRGGRAGGSIPGSAEGDPQ